jgi:hypothetical protein
MIGFALSTPSPIQRQVGIWKISLKLTVNFSVAYSCNIANKDKNKAKKKS